MSSGSKQTSISSFFGKGAKKAQPASTNGLPALGLPSLNQSDVPEFKSISNFGKKKAEENERKRKAAREASSNKKRKPNTSDEDQYALDLGQKVQITCVHCGMLYSPGVAEDEKVHKKFHAAKLKPISIAFVPWKGMNMVKEWTDGSFVACVDQGSPDSTRKKVIEIRDHVDLQLGFPVSSREPEGEKMYIFVISRKVAGCVIVERISQAATIIDEVIAGPSQEFTSPNKPELAYSSDEPTPRGSLDRQTSSLSQMSLSRSNSDASVVVTKTKEPATLGISRIWVHESNRRDRVASRLLDVVRSYYEYGSVIPKNQVAMSQPTPDGRIFATNYFGTPSFLVYEY